jgi:hypothetical protein
VRQHGARDAEQAEHIGAEQTLGLIGTGFLDRAQQAIAGIVDQDVDAAELLHCLSDGLMCLVLVGDIEPGRQQPLMRAEPLGNGGGIAGRGNHRIACSQGLLCDQSTKSPGSSCDEPDTHVVAPLLWPGGFAGLMGKPYRLAINEEIHYIFQRLLRKIH